MSKFKALRIESILDQIDRGLTPDLGCVHWNDDQGRYIADVSALSKYESKAIKGATGLPVTIHRFQTDNKRAVTNSQFCTVESIMSQINNRVK